MTDSKRLTECIENAGLKKVVLANRLGITKQALHNKIAGVSEFKASELATLKKILPITTEEFSSIFLNE